MKKITSNRQFHHEIQNPDTCLFCCVQGEHGIGLGKKSSLVKELGTDTIDVMRAIKRSLDPHWLLNPGKIFDFVDGYDGLSKLKKAQEVTGVGLEAKDDLKATAASSLERPTKK